VCCVKDAVHCSAKASDVGVVLGPNSGNWWTLDTCHLAVSDVQVGTVVRVVVNMTNCACDQVFGNCSGLQIRTLARGAEERRPARLAAVPTWWR
jgi:hypothetical protein